MPVRTSLNNAKVIAALNTCESLSSRCRWQNIMLGLYNQVSKEGAEYRHGFRHGSKKGTQC